MQCPAGILALLLHIAINIIKLDAFSNAISTYYNTSYILYDNCNCEHDCKITINMEMYI